MGQRRRAELRSRYTCTSPLFDLRPRVFPVTRLRVQQVRAMAPSRPASIDFRRYAWIIPLGLIALYCFAWVYTPLFYDEASLRRRAGRAFIDGFLWYAVFPDCKIPTPVPLSLMPANAVFSWIDSWPYWFGVRFLPIAGTLAAVAATIAVTLSGAAKSNLANRLIPSLLICGGFVGLSGVGLVLSRAEFVASAHLAACLLTWVVAKREPRLGTAIALAAGHLAILTLSLFIHVQGMLIVPISVVTLIALLRRWPALMWSMLIVIAAACVQTWIFQQFNCPDAPQIEALIARTQGSILPDGGRQPIGLAEDLFRRIGLFLNQFPFQSQEAYSIPTPPVPSAVAAVGRIPVWVAVGTNFLLVLFLVLAAAIQLAREYVPAALKSPRSLFMRAINDGRVLWLGAAVIFLSYSFFDVGVLFYRAHYRNFLASLLIATAATYLMQRRCRVVLGVWSAILASLTVASTIVALMFAAPQLAAGYESVYVSLVRDWPQFNQRIQSLAAKCGIRPGDEHVVVDVATYNAMRENPRPIDYNYVWYAEFLDGHPVSRTEEQWLDFYGKYSSSGFVVLCRTVALAPMHVQYKDGEICCSGF